MKNFVAILILILFSKTTFSQYAIKNNAELASLQKLPQEKIYVHHSASLVFTGEYIYYKVYCKNAQDNRLSTISSVAYVTLIDTQGKQIFKHKVKLQKGLATGDFFINTTIPSGNYKLIAYTQWMKNSGVEQVFKDDIVIVNPYLSDQTALLNVAKDSTVIERKDSLITMNKAVISNSNSFFELNTSRVRFSKREKVELELRNYKGKLGNGNYSLLIQKKNEFASSNPLSAEEYSRGYLRTDKALVKKVGDSIFLPEQRGELFFGRVIDKKTELPASDIDVVISIPGKEPILKNAISDKNGNFYTYIKKDYKNSEIIVQVLNEGDFKIDILKQKELDFSKIKFTNFLIKEEYAESIKSRSVYNQIENNFFSIKPDSILPKDNIDLFDGGLPEIYNLDEYTRFPTLQETFVEILSNVGYRKGGEYIRVAQEFEKVNIAYNDFPAIVLIDGVFIQNHSEIRDFNSELIERILVLQDRLVLGSTEYQGLVSIETKKGDFFENYTNTNTQVSHLEYPRIKKNYFKQQYSNESDSKRIPDYRRILLWYPDITIKEGSLPITFFTSDIKGDYEIVMEGFTTYGKPISLKKTIRVD
ncbi:hypothetical protein [uncultured Croceitalea sp.]|uniref:hypothetical protein n=1 Tax=uncultured Croceitalea sp. TaxID=1798908 RepID=UPI0033060141